MARGIRGESVPDRWLDRVLAAAYRRAGRWYLPGAAVAGWLLALGFGYVEALLFARFSGLDSQARLRILIGLSIVFALGAVAGFILSVWILRLSQRRLNGDSVDDLWAATMQRPYLVIAANLVPAAIWIPTASVYVLSREREFDVFLLAFALIGEYGGVFLTVTAAIFAVPTVLRPVMRDLAARHGRPSSTHGGPWIRRDLLFFVPGMALCSGTIGVASGFSPNVDTRYMMLSAGISILVALGWSVPLSTLLARSVLTPLREVLKASERMKVADFGTPVPELWSDEFAVIARSLNEAMTGLADRERLAIDNEALLADVQASRVRIVKASDEARRRVERDLHDGAQQRLVALLVGLKTLADSCEDLSHSEIAKTLEDLAAELKESLVELRELASGLHPTVLSTQGIGAAVRKLSDRSNIPVSIECSMDRFPESVEVAAYFVVAEALANVAKYASAKSARVVVESTAETLVVSIKDDGIGGVDITNGTGVLGLMDRVAALGGSLAVSSPLGQGTLIRAEIPLSVTV